MFRQTYYTMKLRLGGEHLTVRDKLLKHRLHSCPGNVYHIHPRSEILFRRRVNYGHKCYIMYWRSHKSEHIHPNLLDNNLILIYNS